MDILRNEKTAQQAVASTPTAISPGQQTDSMISLYHLGRIRI